MPAPGRILSARWPWPCNRKSSAGSVAKPASAVFRMPASPAPPAPGCAPPGRPRAARPEHALLPAAPKHRTARPRQLARSIQTVGTRPTKLGACLGISQTRTRPLQADSARMDSSRGAERGSTRVQRRNHAVGQMSSSPRESSPRSQSTTWPPGFRVGLGAYRKLHHDSWHIGRQPLFGPPTLIGTPSCSKRHMRLSTASPTTREDLARPLSGTHDPVARAAGYGIFQPNQAPGQVARLQLAATAPTDRSQVATRS